MHEVGIKCSYFFLLFHTQTSTIIKNDPNYPKIKLKFLKCRFSEDKNKEETQSQHGKQLGGSKPDWCPQACDLNGCLEMESEASDFPAHWLTLGLVGNKMFVHMQNPTLTLYKTNKNKASDVKPVKLLRPPAAAVGQLPTFHTPGPQDSVGTVLLKLRLQLKSDSLQGSKLLWESLQTPPAENSPSRNYRPQCRLNRILNMWNAPRNKFGIVNRNCKQEQTLSIKETCEKDTINQWWDHYSL